MPVVTPSKPLRGKNNVAATAPHVDFQSTYYVHRSDALAQQEEAHLEALKAHQEACLSAQHNEARSGATGSGEETCTSSSEDDMSVDESSSPKMTKKRKVSEMNASSSEEESNFFSANDEEEEMSISETTTPSDSSSTQMHEKKRCKLATVQIH
jgi:hypothetical protein